MITHSGILVILNEVSFFFCFCLVRRTNDARIFSSYYYALQAFVDNGSHVVAIIGIKNPFLNEQELQIRANWEEHPQILHRIPIVSPDY